METQNTNAKPNLGRLEPVDLRKAWPNEAGDFTPWLADENNIVLLGDTIGMELEVESQEKDVGPFRADILCKDTATDHWVLIENQLEKTNHVHLGQLITYAAGLNAVTIVWIAQRFTDEHRAALDWLNEITGENIAFFGLELELWRIDNSPIAPKFNLVSFPNPVTKPPTSTGTLTAGKAMQLEFWTAFRDYVATDGATFKPTKAQPQHWMSISIGKSGLHLNAIASLFDSVTQSWETHELRAQLELTDEHAKAYYAQLFAAKNQIEQELGEPLEWDIRENKKSCRIFLRENADLHDRSQWPKYFEWLKVKLEALRKVFRPRVKMLGADLGDGEAGQMP